MRERIYKSLLCLIGAPFVLAVLVFVAFIIITSPLLALINPKIINLDGDKND